MLRNSSKGRERCKTYVQWYIILHGTFGEKKTKLHFGKNARALLRKRGRFQTYRI